MHRGCAHITGALSIRHWGDETARYKAQAQGQSEKALQDAVTCFENHGAWMQCDDRVAAGYAIASAVVEASCGHTVKSSMEGTGRRRSIKGAESTLLVRPVYTSNHRDAYWRTHRQLEGERLYSV